MRRRSISRLLLSALSLVGPAPLPSPRPGGGASPVSALSPGFNPVRPRAAESPPLPPSPRVGAIALSLAASPPPPEERSNLGARDEAARLLARAREIRDSLPPEEDPAAGAGDATKGDDDSGDAPPSVGCRLYVDVGREDGTWMDPRWGASGARIEFTVDVGFATPRLDDAGEDSSLAGEDVRGRMVKDNFGGKSTPVRVLRSAPYARLRGGFDKMGCHGGGYRIDVGGGSSTVRFHLLVDGTPEVGSSYGDIFIPKGCLHFSIPCFGADVKNLSRKEAPVTVRQVGWHTGWRREESRMVGTVRALPIEEAKSRDRY